MLKREHVLAILADKKPHPRRNWLRAIRSLMQFALSIGLIPDDPTVGIKITIPKTVPRRTGALGPRA